MTLETSFEMFELFADPELDQDALAPSGQWPGDRQFDVTVESWEQGRSKPSAHAALLIKLVEKFPKILDHLREV